jgi:hypothetical protein
MSDYPEWVLAHKKKGTYINKVGEKYYLYAAHSARVPGTNKVKRICDGYLGRITKEDGFIPSKDKVSVPVQSYEYGLSSLTFQICENIYKGFKKTFVVNGDFIMVASVLTYIYGFYSQELFHHSWLSILYPDLVFPTSVTSQQVTGIERGVRMITETMKARFGEELSKVQAAFSLVTLVYINQKYYCCALPDSVLTFIEKYTLNWRENLWQK